MDGWTDGPRDRQTEIDRKKREHTNIEIIQRNTTIQQFSVGLRHIIAIAT